MLLNALPQFALRFHAVCSQGGGGVSVIKAPTRAEFDYCGADFKYTPRRPPTTNKPETGHPKPLKEALNPNGRNPP